MKKILVFTLTIVLTAAMLVGCGCTNQNMAESSAPTVLPTNEEVLPSTRETSAPTTESTSAPTTMPSEPSETIDRGNGPLEDTSAPTQAGNGSAGRSMPKN